MSETEREGECIKEEVLSWYFILNFVLVMTSKFAEELNTKIKDEEIGRSEEIGVIVMHLF